MGSLYVLVLKPTKSPYDVSEELGNWWFVINTYSKLEDVCADSSWLATTCKKDHSFRLNFTTTVIKVQIPFQIHTSYSKLWKPCTCTRLSRRATGFVSPRTTLTCFCHQESGWDHPRERGEVKNLLWEITKWVKAEGISCLGNKTNPTLLLQFCFLSIATHVARKVSRVNHHLVEIYWYTYHIWMDG